MNARPANQNAHIETYAAKKEQYELDKPELCE